MADSDNTLNVGIHVKVTGKEDAAALRDLVNENAAAAGDLARATDEAGDAEETAAGKTRKYAAEHEARHKILEKPDRQDSIQGRIADSREAEAAAHERIGEAPAAGPAAARAAETVFTTSPADSARVVNATPDESDMAVASVPTGRTADKIKKTDEMSPEPDRKPAGQDAGNDGSQNPVDESTGRDTPLLKRTATAIPDDGIVPGDHAAAIRQLRQSQSAGRELAEAARAAAMAHNESLGAITEALRSMRAENTKMMQTIAALSAGSR